MRKLTLFIVSLLLSFSAVAQINFNTSSYTVKSVNRGYLYYDSANGDFVTSSSHTNIVDATPDGSENQQFAFLRTYNTNEGECYMYSVAAKKFVTYAGGNEVALELTTDPVCTWKLSENSGYHVIMVPGTSNTCINITNWMAKFGCKVTGTAADDGNRMTLGNPNANVDLSAAIAKIYEYEGVVPFATPETGKFYKIKGENATKPWLTATTTNAGNVVVSNDEASAGVFLKTENGIRAVATGKYLGYTGGKYTYSDTELNIKLLNTGDHIANYYNKYAVVSGKDYMLNNNTDGIVHESDIATAANERLWAFIEVEAPAATVNGVLYETLQAAAAAVQAGQTLTLWKNSIETIVLPFGVTLDKNGFTADNVTETLPVAQVGETKYETFAEALEATKEMTGDVTVEILDKVTFNQPLIGNYSSIKFVGKAENAEMYLDVQGYTTATGKEVTFTDLKLSKSEGGFITNAGFMNVAFGIYDVNKVTYNNCTFLNGAYASSGDVTFNNCTFYKSWDKYGLWAYGNVDVTVQGSTFADYRGIKMYAENGAAAGVEKANLTVKNTNFSAVDNKPAIVLTYGESVVLEGNTYSSTGTFELDLDGKPNGVAVTSDVAPVCVNDNGACGVLVDGKIYTTVAQAAEAATETSTVTLLHNSAETVALPMGVTLNKNNFEAAGVTVAVPVAKIGDVEYATLAAAIEDAQAGDEIVVIADIADVTVDVTKNLTISGAATLNNVAINANGADALTVKGLTFTGNSWINSGTAEALTVSGVTATVAPSNTAYTNSRSAFISLGRNEGQELALTLENNNITVTSSGPDAVLGWAKITAATITGNVIKGSSNGYFTNADAIKFMSIADGAEFVINNNEIYSNYNGIVFAQNTTRDNAYSVSIDNNKFLGDADHIWIEISGGNTVHATVNATSANTVNGNAFTVADIKYHSSVINNWTSYAGVDVVTDENGKVIGGTLASFSNAESVAEGYEIGTNGAVGKASVAEVNGVKYASFADAAADAQAGDEIKLLANIEGGITVPANVTLNGNGFAISGGILAEGDITFAGVTTAADFDAKVVNTAVNIPASASLQLTGSARLVIGHGATFNITGTIEDAKTADKATLVPSLKIAAGASITGNGVTFNVNNAYIVANANTTSKNSNADGTLDFNINNSIWEQTGVLAFYVPTSGKDPVVNFELKNSVLTTTSHLVFSVTKGEIVFDNSLVNQGTSRQLENRSTMTIKNGSVVNGAVATSSNAINPGTIIVENATYAVTGEFSGAAEGKGTLVIKKGANVSVGSIKAGANVTVDATGMAAGDEINFTANLSQFTGTLSVSNNDKLEASFVDGKIVLAAKPVAKIGDQGYATLDEAVNAAKVGDKITLLDDADLAFAHNPQYNNVYASEIDLNGKTMTMKKGDVRFDNVTIKNGNIIVQPGTYSGTAIFLMYSKDLTLDGVKVTATGVAAPAYLIGLEKNGNNPTSNLTLNNSEIIINNESLVNIGSIIAVNGSGNTVTIKDSKIDVKNSNARLYLGGTKGNITVENSNINLNGVKEGFYLRAGQTLAITGESDVKITLLSNEGRYGINLTDATAKYTKAETATVNATLYEPAKGSITVAYTSETSIWGEGGGNAKESLVIKVLDANDNVMGTSTLNNVGGIIDGDVYVTWSIMFNAPAPNPEAYWSMEWTTAPSVDNMPAKVAILVDGVEVGRNNVVLNGPDDLNKIVAAVTDADGKILSCHTSVANAAATNATNIALLRETNEQIILPAGVELNKNGFTAAGVTVKMVAKVGNTEYSSIDKAIAAWTNGTTLTLLDNVTLSKVIKLNSTEHHILNLGTYTMTAASGNDAIEILPKGVGTDAKACLTINADTENPGGITATGKSCIYYYNSEKINDRMMVTINGGVFEGSYAVNSLTGPKNFIGIVQSPLRGQGAAYYVFNGGTFNAQVLMNAGMLKVTGGTFNKNLTCYGDITAYRLITGGKFSGMTMTADAEGKFTIGSEKSKYDVGVHVDDNGYLVVGGAVVTEAGDKFEASANYSGASSYLQYSSAKDNGLYYTSVKEAFADNNKTTGVVTVYADEIDMTGITYKGTIIVPAGESVKIKNAPVGLKVATTDGNIIVNNNGTYESKVAVAKIGETKYTSLAEALTKAQNGETINLVWAEGAAPIAMNGAVFGKNVTITGTAKVDWSKGWLFVGRGGAGNATVTFDGANLTSVSDNASTGIHVSGREKETDNKYDGTVVIKNSTIVLDFLINKGAMTLDNATLTVKNGFANGGRPASETESGEDATATMNLTNGSKLVVNNHNGMGLGYEAIGVMDVDATSTFEATENFLVTAKGTMNVAGTVKLAEGKTLTNNGAIVLTALEATLTANECGNVTTNVADHKAVYAGGAYKVVAKVYVAKVGDVKFETLNEAVAAVEDGGTITLIANETFTKNNRFNNGGWWDGLGYSGDKSFTIDLGGFTVSQDGSLNDYLFWFKNVGSKANTITIKNGTLDAGTTAYCALCTASSHENKLTINTENLTLINNISNGSTVKVRAGSVLNVKGGTKITGKNSYLGIENWNAEVNIYDGAEIYMNGTTSYNGCLVGVSGGGTVNVFGGYGKGAKGGFIAMTSGGTINIEGGEWIANTDGTVGNNSNLYVLTAQSNKYESGFAGASIINVTGGTFRGGMDAWVLNNLEGEKAELNISGGNFNANPTNYVVKDYIAVKNNDVWNVVKAAAKIGEKAYATLEEAFKAATDGCTIDILSDVTVDYAWDARKTGAKFTVPVTINGNGKTIKFTASVNDNNYQAPFRFEADATVKNLIVDMSEVTDNRFRAISSKGNLTVDGCKFIGKDETLNCRAIIFGEGAGTNVGNLAIAITNSEFINWKRGITDNENGQDVKTATITGNTLENAAVYVSAKETVTFTGNTVAGAYVNIKSYTDGNKLAVTATGNTLEANTDAAYNVIDAGGVVNAEGFNVVAKGGKIIGYTSTEGIWGEVWGNARNSFVIKVLDANDNVMGTSSLNNVGGIIDGDVTVSWNLKFNAASNTDEYWTMAWTTAPTINNMPAKVQLWVDGVKVSEGNVVLNGPDNLWPIAVAVTDENGVIKSCAQSLKDAVAAAQAGETVAILKAGTYALKVKNNITITGAVEGVEFANIGAFGCDGANVTFNNVTFTYAENSTYKGLQHSGNLVYNNCTFNGQVFLYGQSETFNKCTFNQTTNNYNVWTYGAKEVAFNECTFNSAGKSVLIYAESASITNDVTVKESTFNASQAVDGKAAIEMDASLTAGINLTIDAATTATGFAAGNVSGNSLWNNKKGNADDANNDITVVVAGETVLAPVYEAKIGEKNYRNLQDAINAVQDGETVVLTQDFTGNVTLTEKTGLYYTIDGAGKLFKGSISVNSLSDTNDNRRITIKNIKFVDTADAKVDFISSVNTNHYPRLTIDGCTFTGSGNDGDVAVRLKSSHSVVIKGCTGTGLHSFLQNTSGWNLTIENVTVTNSKSGFALGTVQGVTVKGCEANVKGYGIRLDANTYNNNAVIESNAISAFIPVVVRNANTESNITVEGTNNFNASNTDGLWMAVGTSEYEKNGELPTAATGQVKVALTDTGLDAAGIYGSYYDSLTIYVGAAPKSRMVTRDIYVATMDEAVAEAKATNAGAVIYKVYGEVELTTGGSHGILDLGKNVVIEGISDDAKLTIVGGGVPDIKGVTFKNIILADEGTYLPTANEFMYQNYIDCTFENVTFVDGIRLSGTSSIKDSKVDANTANEYAIWLDDGDFTMTGTTVVGGADAYGLVKSDKVDKITITGNTFQYLGEANKEALNVKEAVVIAENNKFIDCVKGILPADKTNYTDESKTTAATDATILADNKNTVTVNYAAVGEQKFETLLEAINAVQEGQTITLLRDVTMDYNARDAYATQAQNVVINGNGKVLTLNQKNSDWASFGLANNSKLVLNNMTIEKTGYGDTSGAWNTHAIIFSCPVEMNNVTVNNSVAVQTGAALTNVTINEANGYYGLWINGNGQTVTVNGGSITATNGGRGIKIADQYIDAPAQVTLTVDGTVFNTAKKAAVLVSSTAGAQITAANVNIENVAEDKVNFVWVDEDWAANYGNVQVTGATVAQEGIESFVAAVTAGEAVKSYHSTLRAAVEAAQNGETVELLANVTLAGGYEDATEGLRIEREITLNGNGHTIDCGTFQKGIRIYNLGTDGDFHVDFNNVVVVNNVANGRCIDTRSHDINLTITDSKLIAQNGNSQPLTIGGDKAIQRVKLDDAIIDAGNSGYGVIAFVPVKQNIYAYDNTKVTGYAAFYLKDHGNANIKLSLGKGTYIGKNIHSGASNAFGTVVLEGDNNILQIIGTNPTLKAITEGNASQAVVLVIGANNKVSLESESAAIDIEGENAYYGMISAENAGATTIINKGNTMLPVAEVGGFQFLTIKEAIRYAGNEGTIKIVNDIVLAEAWTIPAGKKYTLDLNGKTVSYTSAVAGEDMITNRGNLTITDSSDAKTGKLAYVNTDNTASNVTVSTISTEPGSTLVVDGGTIENKTVKADGSSIYSFAIDILTNGNLGDVNVTINGGTVYSDYMAIRQFNNGTACKNSLTINGGYIYGAKRAVQVHMNNNAAVTAIKGGKVEAGAEGYALCNFAATSDLAVTGGEFIGAVYSARENFISGGIYDAEVYAGYCAQGYMPNKNLDGTYGVVLVANVVATVDGYAFGTLAEAIKAVKAGDNTIELLADCAENVTIAQVNGTNIVINGNGKTYTGTITVKGDGVQNNLSNTETLTFQNINFAPASGKYAIDTQMRTYARNITVDGCTFKGNNDVYAIRARNAYNYTVKNTTAEGVYTFFNAQNVLTGLTVENVSVKCANVAFSGAYGFGVALFKNVNVESDNNGVKVNNPNVSALTFENCSITAKAPVTFIESAGYASALTAEFNGTNTMVVNNGGTYWFDIVEADGVDATFKAIVNDADLDMSNTAFAASVGNVYYSSLQKAIDTAVDNETVVVARNIELNAEDAILASGNLKVMVNVVGKNIILDMNGKEISLNHQGTTVAERIYAVVSVEDGAGLTVTGDGSIDIDVNDETPRVAYMFLKRGNGYLVIDNGNYHMDDTEDSMVYTTADEVVTINGGTFILDKVGTRPNLTPWILNTKGNNEIQIIVNGGTFNYDINHQYRPFEVFVPENLAVKANGDGTWTIAPAQAYVTELLGDYVNVPGSRERKVSYATVAEAIAATNDLGKTVTIFAGDYTMDIAVNKAGVTVQGEVDENGNNLVNITGCVAASTGTTVKNLNVKNEKTGKYDCALSLNRAKDVTIDGVNLSGYNAIAMGYADGNITIKNSVIEGANYAVHFDGNAGGVIAFENSTITGWCAYASTIESVTYTNCTLNKGNYSGQRFYNKNVAFNECTFGDGFKIELTGKNQNVAFTDSDMTMDDVKALMNKDSYITSHNVTLNNVKVTYAVSAQGKLYSTLQAAIDDLPVGGTATYWLNLKSDNVLTEGVVVPAGVKATINLNGFDIIGTPAEAKAFAVITNRGTLTIEGKGSVICNHTLAGSTGYAVNTITNCGTLTIEDNAIIENKSTAQYQIGYAIDNNSTTANAKVTVVSGNVTVSGSNYYDGIRQFCNSTEKENWVVVNGGNVSSIWMQNPSDGATQNTKDVKGYVGISGGKVGVLSLEPSANFEAAVTGGHIGEVSYFQTAEGRNLVQFVTGGKFDTEIAEDPFLAYGYQLTGDAAPYEVKWTGRREEVTFIDGEFTEYTNENDIEVGTLTYKRSFSKYWTPFYVPFEVPVSQLAAQGFEVAYINGVRRGDSDYDGELDKFVMEVIYIHGGNANGSAKTLKANYPYFVRSNDDTTKKLNIVLNNADLYAAKDSTYDCTTFTQQFVITGNNKLMKPDEFAANDYRVAVKDGESGWSNSASGDHRPFRFYMTVTSREDNSPIVDIRSMAIAVRGEELPDGTTVIYDVYDENIEDMIFDLQGRRVLETEKGGIYIKGGKKFIAQ